MHLTWRMSGLGESDGQHSRCPAHHDYYFWAFAGPSSAPGTERPGDDFECHSLLPLESAVDAGIDMVATTITSILDDVRNLSCDRASIYQMDLLRHDWYSFRSSKVAGCRRMELDVNNCHRLRLQLRYYLSLRAMLTLQRVRRRIHAVSTNFIREAVLARAARKKREKKVLQNLRKLPAEIRLLILDEYIRLQPPTVTEDTGRLHHPLIDDQTTKLDPKTYHSIFHTTPLKLHRTIDATGTPLKRAVQWPRSTPKFLILHDTHCKKFTREHMLYEIRCTITVPTTCGHHIVIFYPSSIPSDPSQRWIRETSKSASHTDPSSSTAIDNDCSSICFKSAHHACKIWHDQFMLPNDIHWRNVTKFEVVFVKEKMLAKVWRWAKTNPRMACWKAVLGTVVFLFGPVVLAGLLGYLLPFWTVRTWGWLKRWMGTLWAMVLEKVAKVVARIRRFRRGDRQAK
ncbi:hypothetical protein CERZMDRAFT_88380 [Cercospora zeae-maydis SCOH1-5]|uniref:Uncharacterized protein n=1 Tax=Cercospora zeae-maydis SCOH1-5 TaxID=717836 RepID=A0A6A6F2P5_9PEZI|nr:hypothetical protein CERZMDRAFT_88380 [Cercospora zeae-maydis SCOH1-5]